MFFSFLVLHLFQNDLSNLKQTFCLCSHQHSFRNFHLLLLRYDACTTEHRGYRIGIPFLQEKQHESKKTEAALQITAQNRQMDLELKPHRSKAAQEYDRQNPSLSRGGVAGIKKSERVLFVIDVMLHLSLERWPSQLERIANHATLKDDCKALPCTKQDDPNPLQCYGKAHWRIHRSTHRPQIYK